MNKKCIFCNKPILSDYASLVYFSVKGIAARQDGTATAKLVAKELKMSVCEANNYLSLLCQLDLLSRWREGNHFVYRWHKY